MPAKAFLLIALSYVAVASPIDQRATCASLYGQCGGSGYTGPTCCASGSVCKYSNDWYSQCVSGVAVSAPTSQAAAASTSKVQVAAAATSSVSTASAPTSSTVVKAAAASSVSGSAMGFAAGVTGGGNAAPVYPTTIADLIKYLGSDDPQVIVISGTYNFVGSEGTESFKACKAYSCDPDNGGQMLLNTLGGCGTNALSDVTIDKAGGQGITVKSDKTLIGTNKATLNGKGLRMVGVSNIIIQNIAITNLNPKYVWGGDAFVLSDTSTIWIDHVTTSLTGRQHYSFGQQPNKAITISNSFINGKTTQSATCDGHTYWGLELVGQGDQITFYKNYVYYTSGRSPALSGITLFHAVNSIWSSNSGHALEGGLDNGRGLFEGCVIEDVPVMVQPGSGWAGKLFTSPASSLSQCTSALGRACMTNIVTNSGAFDYSDTSFFGDFGTGYKAPAVVAASQIQNTVPTSAGATL